jgi:hypothetical protein
MEKDSPSIDLKLQNLKRSLYKKKENFEFILCDSVFYIFSYIINEMINYDKYE